MGEHARLGRWLRLAETIFQVRERETRSPAGGTPALPGIGLVLVLVLVIVIVRGFPEYTPKTSPTACRQSASNEMNLSVKLSGSK
jgi:hypothetical protein